MDEMKREHYAQERCQQELALRMIGHEARTCTIRSCTALSDDRIRRLYGIYFKRGGKPLVRRQRGRSPRRTRFYVKNALNQSDTSMLALLFASFDLLAFAPDTGVHCPIARNSLEYGWRVCSAFETYRSLRPDGRLGFERVWTLLEALVEGSELRLHGCRECMSCYVHHLLEIDDGRCPCCKLKGIAPSRRRNRVACSAQAGRPGSIPAAFLPLPRAAPPLAAETLLQPLSI